ncbi:hypothetical protein PUN28_001369 [Cardiocondyla obscurior]|uniref:Uncharacterized protein n=1 Tax=Cardiocondyla obscurior TaxID=286306 RepID=A0AAW2H4Q2_9HYME
MIFFFLCRYHDYNVCRERSRAKEMDVHMHKSSVTFTSKKNSRDFTHFSFPINLGLNYNNISRDWHLKIIPTAIAAKIFFFRHFVQHSYVNRTRHAFYCITTNE